MSDLSTYAIIFSIGVKYTTIHISFSFASSPKSHIATPFNTFPYPFIRRTAGGRGGSSGAGSDENSGVHVDKVIVIPAVLAIEGA